MPFNVYVSRAGQYGPQGYQRKARPQHHTAESSYHARSCHINTDKAPNVYEAMKNFALLLAATLATLAAADVRIYSDIGCESSDESLVQTKAGHCYDLPEGRNSAGGCSKYHDLKIFDGPRCTGDSVIVKPQWCAAFGDRAVASIMCL
nr:hypothetical protein B0A51_04442 [Rachicladosporium sp. CCFEE 5018]